MLVKTLKSELLIGDRVYFAGSVIDLDDTLARRLVDALAVAIVVAVEPETPAAPVERAELVHAAAETATAGPSRSKARTPRS